MDVDMFQKEQNFQSENFSHGSINNSLKPPLALRRIANGSQVQGKKSLNPFEIVTSTNLARNSVYDQQLDAQYSNNFQQTYLNTEGDLNFEQNNYEPFETNFEINQLKLQQDEPQIQINRNFSSNTTVATQNSTSNQFECENHSNYTSSNMFSVISSPTANYKNQKSISINKRLFHDDDDKENSLPQENLFAQIRTHSISNHSDFNYKTCKQEQNPMIGIKSFVIPQRSSNLEDNESLNNDVDEFQSNERRPLEKLLLKRGKNEFIFDPENGGGRRRRIKKLSRLEMIGLGEETQIQSNFRSQMLVSSAYGDDIVNDEDSLGNRPLRVQENLYQIDSDAQLLQRMEDCRNPDLNTICPSSLAQLFDPCEVKSSLNRLVIDCRFDYEFNGGHIEGAINLNTPEQMEDYFFKNKETIENLMSTRTVIIFHCEFSQHRGPKMYRALREIDRRLHIDYYPQLFYSEIYLLEGGYKEFHNQYPHLCEGTYTPMADKNFKQDCKEQFSNCRKVYKQYSTREVSQRLQQKDL